MILEESGSGLDVPCGVVIGLARVRDAGRTGVRKRPRKSS